jgi:cellulose synthase/poly-beta-1,6-N-acetylglucosamine synthase-like glycosyltransferase
VIAAGVFWASTAALVWVYVGYPAVVAVLARFRPIRLRPTGPRPALTVAIAAHDEAGTIAERIEDVFAQEASGVVIAEVIVGSDGSRDETDAIVRRLATREPRLRLIVLDRAGQTTTQAALFEAATADVIVLTDAETRFAPGCLAALAEPFRDPLVGCATGRLEWRDEDATATSSNEGLYWRYERRIRELESRAGFLTAVTGALLAVRRSAYRPVPATASMDHLLPLYVRERHGIVMYVPAAIATDRPISGAREQFRNRTRTATRGIRANLSMAGRLTPWRHPAAATALWSHKLLRWATPWLALATAVSGLLIGSSTSGYLIAPIAIGLGGAMAALGHLLARTGRRPPRLIAFARSFGVVNLAFANGWVNVVRGRGIEVWHGAEWRAEH